MEWEEGRDRRGVLRDHEERMNGIDGVMDWGREWVRNGDGEYDREPEEVKGYKIGVRVTCFSSLRR